jgi:FAD:protein FMN transferase
MESRVFSAMGTTVELRLDAPSSSAADDALDEAVAAVIRIEATCTRFDEASELATLNRAGSGRVSAELAEIIGLALDARTRTGGLFDPTVHDAVVAAGYDRTFDEIVDRPPHAGVPGGGEVELHGDRVVLGPGARLDLGGIAKGYAADRACDILRKVGPCLVDAGGDIAVAGTWAVGVDGGPTLELTDCAVATTGRDRRTWLQGAGTAHHLIDPSTGLPARTETVRATVVAATATEAEVLAKAAFLGAPAVAPTILVLEDGRAVLAGGLA